MNVNAEIEKVIGSFVDQLTVLVRKAALESAQQALGASRAPAPRRANGRAASAASNGHASPSAAAAAPVRLPRRKKGQKRAPKDLERIVKTLRDHIAANPGQGVEHISKNLGVPTSELALPIAKLLDQKAITRKGQKRGTRYFAAR